MLILKTEELSSTGWHRLGLFLGQPRLHLQKFEATANVHEHIYEPTQAERDAMRQANMWDVQLYKHLPS